MKLICSRGKLHQGPRLASFSARRWFGKQPTRMHMAVERVHRWPNSLVTLAIETSCDDTCVAILEKKREGAGSSAPNLQSARLLFEERITADNRAFTGIHPVAATESHMAFISPLVQRAMKYLPQAESSSGNIPDFVSATRGPGMRASLFAGLATGKALAVAWQVPFVGVHHMQAHALTPRLVEALEKKPGDTGMVTFPYLSFLVSGGHTLLVHSRSLTDHRVLASTDNIAIGDLLDKCSRSILPSGWIVEAETKAGRSLSYGALLEAFAFADYPELIPSYQYPARRKDETIVFDSGHGWRIRAPLSSTGPLRRTLRFDFSGLNGSVMKLVGNGGAVDRALKTSNEENRQREDKDKDKKYISDDERRLLARATMRLAFEHLASRLLLVLDDGLMAYDADLPAPSCVVVSGGVASNAFLRRVLRSALDIRGYSNLPLVAPPPHLCTDNAAMIAWAGMEMYEAGWEGDLEQLALRKWSMDASEAGGGILGVGGWIRRQGSALR